MAIVGSKFLTSAAIRTSNAEASNEVIGPRRRSRRPGRFAQNVGASLPIGVTAPRPGHDERVGPVIIQADGRSPRGLIRLGDCSGAHVASCRPRGDEASSPS